MLELLRKEGIDKILTKQIAKCFKTEAAADRLCKKIFTSSSIFGANRYIYEPRDGFSHRWQGNCSRKIFKNEQFDAVETYNDGIDFLSGCFS